MSEMLYLQTERNIKITSPVVTLGDVAQLSCSDGAVLARNQVRRVAHLPDDGYGRYLRKQSLLSKRNITKQSRCYRKLLKTSLISRCT